MLRTTTTLCQALSLAALATFSAAIPAAAAPPGSERWVAPGADFNIESRIDVPAEFADNLTADNFGTPGYSPVDVEINWFHPDVDWGSVTPDKVLHTISVLEVENDGPLEDTFTVMSLQTLAADIEFSRDNGYGRPIDIELYYRAERNSLFAKLFGGKEVLPIYASIWVENEGDNYSAWDFIRPTPYFHFKNILGQKYDEGWRPYDIELAVNPNGQVVGTALLAPVETDVVFDGVDESIVLETKLREFTPDDLAMHYAGGWQLLDVEVPPQGAEQDPLVSNLFFDEDVRVGIFVRLPWVFSPTGTRLEWTVTEGDLGFPAGLLPYPFRPIDIEVEGEYTLNTGWSGVFGPLKADEGSIYLFTEAWLFAW